ncbi:hypothetical protein H5410_006179 [Solanum commersonii]|uniref:F-box associated beta-propeller type 3 domain-containing protein n=1 Tax=Solanum commersonii TaxID=4109 RepID=A0A9J6A902_SOLCO|nr:hypothetical protein H5410_006179 [Solanum commersonii]
MDGRSKIRNLPEDIVNSILLELPVKSLSRFKSFCIDDPDFIKSHLHKSSINISRQKIILVNENHLGLTHQFIIMSTEASIRADSKVVHLNEPNIPGFCSNYEYIELENTNSFQILFSSPVFGFAYDFVAEDYKVICLHVHPYLINWNPRYIVEVYSVENQCWRTIHNISLVPTDLDLAYIYNGQVALNGVIHRMSHNNGAEYKIISFHLVDKKFIVTPLPTSLIGKPIIWSVGDFICVKENGSILWRRDEGPFIEYDLRKN